MGYDYGGANSYLILMHSFANRKRIWRRPCSTLPSPLCLLLNLQTQGAEESFSFHQFINPNQPLLSVQNNMEAGLKLGVKCFVIVVLLCFYARLSRAVVEDDLSPSPEPAGAEFIRTSCSSATLYPDLCYTMLSRYADAVGNDRGLLAQAAIFVSLSRAKHVAAYVTREAKSGSGASEAAASALQDCVSSFGNAMDQMRGSLKQMKEIETAGAGAGTGSGSGGKSLRFWASNVQTWMSAALTNQDTCSDGFEGVDEGPLKAEVGLRVVVAKHLTSNALALINRYVMDALSP